MLDSGVYLRTERGIIDLVYEATDEEFRNWVGTLVAGSGGLFAVDNTFKFDPETRFEVLIMLHTKGIVVFYVGGSEYARRVQGQQRAN